MLADNIKALRKQKGYSQETLAQQLNVVRQTVSKWEKGLSVPDAEMLERLAEVFEVSVGKLLGGAVPEPEEPDSTAEVARQLAILNEHFARQVARRRKIWRIVLWTIIGLFLLNLLMVGLFGFVRTEASVGADSWTHVELHCILDGEEYVYELWHDELGRIRSAGGDAWIAEQVKAEDYSDAAQLIEDIESLFTEKGGSVEFGANSPTK